MAKILGLGGLFFKARDPEALRAWYQRVLGLEFQDWGGTFMTPDAMSAHAGAGTVFALFKADTDYFAPSSKDFMFNFAVDDLDGVLARCAENGVAPVKVFPDEFNGAFAHIIDPEGNKIELWQPRPMQAG